MSTKELLLGKREASRRGKSVRAGFLKFNAGEYSSKVLLLTFDLWGRRGRDLEPRSLKDNGDIKETLTVVKRLD